MSDARTNPPKEGDKELNSILDEFFEPKGERYLSDLSDKLKALIAQKETAARISELTKMYKDWGEHSLIPWEDYIEARLLELGDSDGKD